MNILRHFTFLLIAIIYSGAAWALEFNEGKIQVHGFLSQGLVSTSHNRFNGNSEDHVSSDYREIGLNASYRARPDLQLSAQLIHLDAGNVSENGVLLDYAFVDYTLVSNKSTDFGVRLGRVKNPFGLYTTTRDVAFTRPSIILPQSIYFDKARSLALSSDGVSAYASRLGDFGAVSVDAVIGNANVDRGSEATFIGVDGPGSMRSSKPTRDVRVMYVTPDDNFRIAFTASSIDLEYDAKSWEKDPHINVSLRPLILSAQYNTENWEFTGEYTQMKTDIAYGGRPDFNNVIEGYYFQTGYRITPTLQAMLRYDESYNDRDDYSGRKNSAITGVPAHVFFAKDWMLGLRYDVTSTFMVRGEFHRVDGTGWLSTLDNPNPFLLERKWNMMMLMGAWKF